MRRAVAVIDVVAVLSFVAIGRTVHTRGGGVGGLASTAWPFLVGLAVGWVVARAWTRPSAVFPTGVTVWPVCVGVAMVLRAVSDQGVAAAFVVVALAFVGLGLLGWRAVAGLVGARPGPSGSTGTRDTPTTDALD